MYKVLIRPVLTYASETWILSKTNEQQLSLFERKVLRCIFGAKQQNGTWRIRYNYEIYETFKEPNIVNYIKVKRLAWAGHLMRMNDDRTIKKIFNTKPDGPRRAGRPKIRWEDGVEHDMTTLGVKNWRRVTLDREKWTKFLNTLRTGHLNCLNPRSQALNTVIQLLYFVSLKIHKKFANYLTRSEVTFL
jgi:hypothetical protein